MGFDRKTLPLRDLAIKITKGTTPTTSGRPFLASGVNYIKSESITTDGSIDESKFAFISQATHENLKRSILAEGDVLFSMAGVYLGKTAVVSKALLPANTNQAVGIIRLDGSKALPEFVHYVLKSPLMQDFIRRSGAQSAQPNFNLQEIGALPIPDLSIKEQGGIAATLGSIDRKLALLNDSNRVLEECGQAIFRSWFVDFDPVMAKSDGREPEGIEEDTAQLFPNSFQQSEIGPIPYAWKLTVLGEVLSRLETGRRPKGGVSGILEGIPSVGAESIVGIGRFDYAKTRYVSHDFFSSMKQGHVTDGDVLLYKDGGRPGVFIPHVTMVGSGFPFEEFCINEHVYRMRIQAPACQYFLYFWLRSERADAEMRNRGTGVAIPGLNSGAVRKVPILIAPREIHDAFSRIAAPLCQCILANSKQAQILSQIRDLLLPKLISGQIRVPEAEAMIENAV